MTNPRPRGGRRILQSPTASGKEGSGTAFTGPNPELFHFPQKSLNGRNLQSFLQTPTSQPLTPVYLSLQEQFLGVQRRLWMS